MKYHPPSFVAEFSRWFSFMKTYPFWRMERTHVTGPPPMSDLQVTRGAGARFGSTCGLREPGARCGSTGKGGFSPTGKGWKRTSVTPIDKAILIHFRGVNYRHFYYITPTQTSRTTCLGMFSFSKWPIWCALFSYPPPKKKPGNSIIPDLIETLFPKSFESTGHWSPIWIYLDLYIELE